MIPRAALRRTLVVLAVVAWPVASLAIVQAEAPSLPALRALARAERVDPPGESIDPPPMLRPIAVGDAALALRSLDDVAQAIAPVRGGWPRPGMPNPRCAFWPSTFGAIRLT